MQRRPLLRVLGALFVATAVAGAGCSDDDTGEGQPESSTSTTAAVPATSTTLPAASTTVLVSVHGVVGWWDGTTWVRATSGGPPPPLVGGEEFTLVGLDDQTSTGRGGAPGEQEFCSAPSLPLSPGFPDYGPGETPPIAIHGVAEPRPRPTTVLAADSPTYRQAAEEALAQLASIDDGDPELAQVVRADLAGDGTDEVLFVAERIAEPSGPFGEAGDYSVLFLRQVVDGEVRTTMLSASRNESTLESPSPFIEQTRVAAIADLNGDGAMEVVVHKQYYEGSGTEIYALSPAAGLAAGGLLANGCGV